MYNVYYTMEFSQGPPLRHNLSPSVSLAVSRGILPYSKLLRAKECLFHPFQNYEDALFLSGV